MAAPRTKARKPVTRVTRRKVAAEANTHPEVMTLAEAAEFLRLSEDQIVRQVSYGDLPGRKVDTEWRFLRAALEQWVGTGRKMTSKEAFLAFAGSWKDDPDVPGMLKEIYRQRGRPEDGE